LIIGGVAERADGERVWVTACFDGKVDAPQLYERALATGELEAIGSGEQGPTEGLLARWNFAAGITDEGIASDIAVDQSGAGHDGRCVNQPDRAATGWNWSGRRDVFTSAPEEYGALGFHSDALDDCRWEADFEFEIPNDLGSGCYAIHVTQGEAEDYIPFYVRPSSDASPAPIAVLIPTLTYIIYGNFHSIYPWEGWGFDPYEAANGVIPLDWRDLEMLENPDDYGLAVYDFHADGRGVQYASWRRPILNARPGQAFSFNFQADFYLIDWLESQGFDYDVITDHDLHEQGAELLEPYQVLVTGSHPEYYTWEMRDAFEDYLAAGGRTIYLGANGFYWVTAIHPDKPWLAEVRRGDTGDTPWHGPPGEYHHSFTGERGGLWRHRGRPPQKLCGTGYASHSFGISGYYVRLPDSYDERVAWMFDGVSEESIGDFGLVGGGAAGMELDVYDRSLGTPPHALLLGSSVEHDEVAMLVPEELFNTHPAIAGDEHPKIRADLVYFTTRDGGGVFSTSSIAWAGSLSANGYANSVSRLTGNVLRRFISPDPLPPIV
jgi:N,N-dimethylformamidase